MLAGWIEQGLAPSVVVDPAPAAARLACASVQVVATPDAIPASFAPSAVVFAVKPQEEARVLPAYGDSDAQGRYLADSDSYANSNTLRYTSTAAMPMTETNSGGRALSFYYNAQGLLSAAQSQLDRATTNAQGHFTFNHLPAGPNFELYLLPPAGWKVVGENVGASSGSTSSAAAGGSASSSASSARRNAATSCCTSRAGS